MRAFLSFNAANNTFVKFLPKQLCQISNKLWYVFPQLLQNRPRHRRFPNFSEYFFDIYIGRTRLCAWLSFLAGNSRLVLTCYKVNSSQSRDGSKNPATFKKDLFSIVFNGRKTFTFVLKSLF